jgi:hypothetical protein
VRSIVWIQNASANIRNSRSRDWRQNLQKNRPIAAPPIAAAP